MAPVFSSTTTISTMPTVVTATTIAPITAAFLTRPAHSGAAVVPGTRQRKTHLAPQNTARMLSKPLTPRSAAVTSSMATAATTGTTFTASTVTSKRPNQQLVKQHQKHHRHQMNQNRQYARTMTSIPQAIQSSLPQSLQSSDSQVHIRSGGEKGQGAAILLFGDSLTLGWTVQNQTAPYGDQLVKLLGVPAGSVVTAGFAGQKASEMSSRLQAELARGCRFDGHSDQNAPIIVGRSGQGSGAGQSFDIVVLLAGTNDLRLNGNPEAVLAQLLVLHNAVRATGALCVAVTVPACGPTDAAARPLAGARRVVNDGLKAAAAAGQQGRGPSLWLADFDAEVARLPKYQSDALFTDSCHFTADGYKLLASVVQAALLPVLPKIGQRATSPTGVPAASVSAWPMSASNVSPLQQQQNQLVSVSSGLSIASGGYLESAGTNMSQWGKTGGRRRIGSTTSPRGYGKSITSICSDSLFSGSSISLAPPVVMSPVMSPARTPVLAQPLFCHTQALYADSMKTARLPFHALSTAIFVA